MSKIKILIPTDFSVQSEYAFVLAKRLEEKIPLDIHFLHVLQVPDTVTMDPSGAIVTCGDIDAGFVEQQKTIALRKLDEIHQQNKGSVSTHLRLGKLTDEITSFAHNHGFHMIVMGTKGAWGLQEKLSGSETQTIARMSDIPLLSMMCDRSDLEVKNMLLVHDFTRPEFENLNIFRLIADSFGANIHLLQIVSDSSNHADIHMAMDTFASLNNLSNYQVHLLNDKDVEKGVTHFNQMHNMDIVCIGTHGNKGVERIIHPSATEKLVNHLFKPILSFHLKNS
jgi:nucleotide-binding universal stress UspA family protein